MDMHKFNPFEIVEKMNQMGEWAAIAGDLAKSDSDHDGQSDLQELAALAPRILANFSKLQTSQEFQALEADIIEASKLVGGNIGIIKERLAKKQ